MKNKKITTDLIPRKKSVLVQRLNEQTQTTGGIIIAEVSKEPSIRAIIVAVGPGCDQDLKDGIGKRVTINRYANLELIDGLGNTFVMIDDNDVQCFISDNTTTMDESAKKLKRVDVPIPTN